MATAGLSGYAGASGVSAVLRETGSLGRRVRAVNATRSGDESARFAVRVAVSGSKIGCPRGTLCRHQGVNSFVSQHGRCWSDVAMAGKTADKKSDKSDLIRLPFAWIIGGRRCSCVTAASSRQRGGRLIGVGAGTTSAGGSGRTAAAATATSTVGRSGSGSRSVFPASSFFGNSGSWEEDPVKRTEWQGEGEGEEELSMVSGRAAPRGDLSWRLRRPCRHLRWRRNSSVRIGGGDRAAGRGGGYPALSTATRRQQTTYASSEVSSSSSTSSPSSQSQSSGVVGANTRVLSRDAGRARLVAQRKEAYVIKEMVRPLAEYMALPASQYSVLDAERIERVDENCFRCYVHTLKFFSIEICPVLLVRVEQQPDGCIIRLLSCTLDGSPIVVEQNKKFTASMTNRVSWTESSQSPDSKELVSDTTIEVSLEIPGPFRVIPTDVIESTGNSVLGQLLKVVLPRFLAQLGKDYRAWASGDDSRKPLGTGQL